MKNKSLLILLGISISFLSGYAFKSFIVSQAANDNTPVKKVTGIGGIFFKCKDTKQLKEWYRRHLGIHTDKYGAVFEWWQGADSSKKGFTQWSPFSEKTKYFEPSTKDWMINYRVENMDKLVEQLKKDSVTVLDTIAAYDYGKFVHILDLEGNKIELWEANDAVYEKMGKELGATTTK